MYLFYDCFEHLARIIKCISNNRNNSKEVATNATNFVGTSYLSTLEFLLSFLELQSMGVYISVPVRTKKDYSSSKIYVETVFLFKRYRN